VNLRVEYRRMIDTICLSETYPYKHFQAANDLIVRMANAGYDPSHLSEILYEITEGYRHIGKKSAGERLREILRWHY